MSGWDAWIEALCSPLPTGGAIGAGAIISLEGDVWGKSDSFPEVTRRPVPRAPGERDAEELLTVKTLSKAARAQISAEEALAVAQGFDNSDKVSPSEQRPLLLVWSASAPPLPCPTTFPCPLRCAHRLRPLYPFA